MLGRVTRMLMASVVVALGAALLPAAAPGPPEAPVAAETPVVTAGLQFVPPDPVVTAGDGLVHANADPFLHNITAVETGPDGAPLFASATIGSGETAPVEGVEDLPPGTYEFLCTVHPTDMQGTLTVEARPSAAPQVLLAPVPGAFQLPVAIAQHPDSDDLYVVEKTGTVRAVRDGLVYDPAPVLDVSDEVSDGLEQGLLGLAFSPDGQFMYVNLTDTAGDTHLLEFGFADGQVVAGTRREVLTVDQPFENHNAGTLAFGPDGHLYVPLGDGGSGGDPHGNAQDVTTLLGSMLRIDPRPADGAPYAVPADNPFVPDPDDPDKVVPEDARPEIWSFGLRNPWKFSFDRDTGDLWIADVGQGAWEEVNRRPATSPGGENYGWNHMEGTEPYEGRPAGAEEPADHVPPIHTYPRESPSCAITGGYLYRGEAIPSLQGAYVYSDWCDGRLRYLRQQDGVVTETGELGVTVPSITSFGEDHDGELYAISLGGAVFRLLPAGP